MSALLEGRPCREEKKTPAEKFSPPPSPPHHCHPLPSVIFTFTITTISISTTISIVTCHLSPFTFLTVSTTITKATITSCALASGLQALPHCPVCCPWQPWKVCIIIST